MCPFVSLRVKMMGHKTYAHIDNEGTVWNCLVWDGVTDLGLDGELVEYTEDNPAHIGGTYVDGVFLPPPPPEPEPDPEV